MATASYRSVVILVARVVRKYSSFIMFSSVRKSVSIALTYQANQNRSQSSLRSILARDQVVGI